MSRPPPDARLIFSAEEIDKAIDRLAIRINLDFENSAVTVLSVLRGALPFTWDLIKRLSIELTLEFVRIERYHGTKGFEPRLIGEFPEIPTDASVLIVDDVLDDGVTLAFLKSEIYRRNRSVVTAALFQKQIGKKCAIEAYYIGLFAPDCFLVGRGMDCDGKYRDLMDVYALPER